MRGFAAAVAPIDRLAATSPGFVWRLGSGDGHGVTVQPDAGGPVFLNLSVWQGYDALHAFTYRTAHAGVLKRRSSWFAPTPQPSTALWWLPAGERPSVEEALRRLRYLREHGPSPQAFSLRRRFTADGAPVQRSRRVTTRRSTSTSAALYTSPPRT